MTQYEYIVCVFKPLPIISNELWLVKYSSNNCNTFLTPPFQNEPHLPILKRNTHKPAFSASQGFVLNEFQWHMSLKQHIICSLLHFPPSIFTIFVLNLCCKLRKGACTHSGVSWGVTVDGVTCRACIQKLPRFKCHLFLYLLFFSVYGFCLKAWEQNGNRPQLKHSGTVMALAYVYMVRSERWSITKSYMSKIVSLFSGQMEIRTFRFNEILENLLHVLWWTDALIHHMIFYGSIAVHSESISAVKLSK